MQHGTIPTAARSARGRRSDTGAGRASAAPDAAGLCLLRERAADAAAAGAVRTGAVLRRERGLSARRDGCARAIRRRKSRKGQERAAGNRRLFQTMPAGASGAAAQKTAAPVGAAVFHPILSWPAAAARGARRAAASAAAARARCLFPRRWPAAAAACRTRTPANSTRR